MKGCSCVALWVTCATFVVSNPAVSGPVSAQETYPSGTIKLIVAAPVGGGTDQIARLIGANLQSQMNRTVVIEARPGGSGIIAADIVARAPPDGLTLLVTFDGHSISGATNKKLVYQPVDSFSPVSQIAYSGILLSTSESAPAKNLRELINWAKNYKGNLNIGVPGVNSPAFVAAQRFWHLTGINAEIVNNRGSPATLYGVLSNSYQFAFASLQASLPMVRNGDLRAIGLTTTKRMAVLPDVPSIAEVLPGFDFQSWYGVLGPANLPAPIVGRLHAEIVKALNTPKMREIMNREGAEPVGSTPEEFRRFLIDDLAKYSSLIK